MRSLLLGIACLGVALGCTSSEEPAGPTSAGQGGAGAAGGHGGDVGAGGDGGSGATGGGATGGGGAAPGAVEIVVLGASTACGKNLDQPMYGGMVGGLASSWVNRYVDYLDANHPG